MKYCPFKVYSYKQNEIDTTSNYVTLEGLKAFHGEAFTKQWLNFTEIGNLRPSKFGKEEGYYFIDYQFYAQRTKMWIESQ